MNRHVSLECQQHFILFELAGLLKSVPARSRHVRCRIGHFSTALYSASVARKTRAMASSISCNLSHLNVKVSKCHNSLRHSSHTMTTTTTTMMKVAALAGLLLLDPTQAFLSPQVRSGSVLAHIGINRAPSFLNNPLQNGLTTTTSANRDTTALSMYNLPPGGGDSGGGGNKNELEGILGSLGAIAAVGLFFASPLGSIFFAITNSLFLLAILVPVVGIAGFQAWQYFYTLSGACPNCGAPVTVLKDSTTEAPSFCFNCGSQLQASSDQKTIEFAKEPTIVDDGFSTTGSIFDALFQQPSSSSMGSAGGNTTPNRGASSSTPKDKESKYRRESTVIDAVIDVEVEDE
jgi:rRNA maturation protein Nop10